MEVKWEVKIIEVHSSQILLDVGSEPFAGTTIRYSESFGRYTTDPIEHHFLWIRTRVMVPTEQETKQTKK